MMLDNTAGIARVGYEEALCHVLSVYPWLIFGDDVNVHGSALRVGYIHGGEYLFSLTTSLAHLTRNIVASCILA